MRARGLRVLRASALLGTWTMAILPQSPGRCLSTAGASALALKEADGWKYPIMSLETSYLGGTLLCTNKVSSWLGTFPIYICVFTLGSSGVQLLSWTLLPPCAQEASGPSNGSPSTKFSLFPTPNSSLAYFSPLSYITIPPIGPC